MKGINLKKIGAIVAGATILASSVAFAGLLYQNTELVNADGQPLAKVVVGASSMASDGVVAASISNKLANEAYKSTTLTAEVVGTATCTGGASGEGTCDVVEGSETVTLEVTVPGSGIEGVHTFTTAIGDYVDKDLENRYTNSSDSDEAYLVLDGFEDTDSNPFQDYLDSWLQNGEDVESDQQTTMYKIWNGNFGPFSTATVVDARSGKEYTEEEGFWVFGNDHWDESDHEVYGEVEFAAYTALFEATGDYGIPLCPGDEDMEFGVTCDDMDSLPAHKVFISFMGGDWVVSQIEGVVDSSPTCDNQPTTSDCWAKQIYQIDNAKVKLAKEAVSGIINVGEIMEAPSGYKVRLEDISREVGMNNAHPAIITVLDANDNEICQDQVYPGQTKDDLCEEHTEVKLHVYQTAPGLNFIAKWAEMAIYKDEITLESNEKFLDPDDVSGSDDTEWMVYLGWTNKQQTAAGSTPGYLREILLYNDEPENMDEMEAGDVFPVVDIAGYEVYDLTYNGVDDEDASWDTLKFKEQTDKNWTVRNSSVDDDQECHIAFTHAVEVTTNEQFRQDLGWLGYASSTIKRGKTMWYIPVGNVTGTDCGDAYNGSDNPVLIFKDTENDRFVYSGGAYTAIQYAQAGSQGYVTFYNASETASGLDELYVIENAGKWRSTDIVDAMGFAIQADFDFSAYDNGGSHTDDDDYTDYLVGNKEAIADNGDILTHSIDFSVLGYQNGTTYKEKFISMRGGEFKSGGETTYEYKIPKSLLKTTWTFSTVESAESEPDTSVFTLHEGEEAAVGTTGVKVKVLAIDQQLTPCTLGTGAGAEPMCTPDMSSVYAVVMPNNVPSVTTIVPYTLTSNLVYLDTDSVALDSGVIITVGGDAVNTVTKDAIAGSDVNFEATPVVVKQLGNKIVVAGYSASDTMAAGQQFLSELTTTN